MQTVKLVDEFFEGAVSLEKTPDGVKPWRLTHDKLPLFDSGLAVNASMTAGVRMRFATDATTIGLALEPTTNSEGQSDYRMFDLTVDGDIKSMMQVPVADEEFCFDEIAPGMKTVEIWFPVWFAVIVRHIIVNDGATVEPVEDTRPKWVTYGSSITHAVRSHSPAQTWSAVVARKHKLNLMQLGYGGQCHMDPVVAIMIRDLPADLITLKMGINMIGGSIGIRTYAPAVVGMVQIIREKHPDTPIALISPIISPANEETISHSSGIMLPQMRTEMERVANIMCEMGDTNLRYFNGADLFGAEQADEHNMPDGLHPYPDGNILMGERFSDLIMSQYYK